jgi:hypothetical protein
MLCREVGVRGFDTVALLAILVSHRACDLFGDMIRETQGLKARI